MKKKSRGNTAKKKRVKTQDKEGPLGIERFIDSSPAETKAPSKMSMRDYARENSDGATNGLVKSLDPVIKQLSSVTTKSSESVSRIKRDLEFNYQYIRRVEQSVTFLENRVDDQYFSVFQLLDDLTGKFNRFKKDTEQKFKKLESTDVGSGGGLLDTALDLLDSFGGGKNNKAKGKVSASKAVTKSPIAKAGTSVLKSVGSVGKGLLSKIPAVGGLVEGVAEYVEGGDLGKSIAAAAGNVLGGIIGGIAGSFVAPGVGTAVGAVGGSMAGADLAKRGYDWITGGAKGPKESAAIKQAREVKEKPSEREPAAKTAAGGTTAPAGLTGASGAGSIPNAPAATGGGSGYVAADYKQDSEFTQELNRVASKFNVDANDLLAVMHSESGVNPSIVNPGSQATGLIQFIPSTARGLGTSVEELRKMSRAQQMKYVEKYFDSVGLPKGATGGQIYASVFLPAFVNKPVLASKGDQYYDANTVLDLDKDGKITMRDLDMRVSQMRSQYGLGGGTAAAQTPGQTIPQPAPGSAASPIQAPGPDATRVEQSSSPIIPQAAPGSAASSIQAPGTTETAPQGITPQAAPGSPASQVQKPVVTGLNFTPGINPNINTGIAQKVSQLQGTVGDLKITSGLRDQKSNAAAGGAKDSAHLRGNAVDVTFAPDPQQTIKVVEAASKAGIGGIGVYQPGWVHLDTESKRVWGRDFTPNSIPQWASGVLSAHMAGKMGEYDATAASNVARSTVGGREAMSASSPSAAGDIDLKGINFAGMAQTNSFMPNVRSGGMANMPQLSNGIKLTSPMAGILGVAGNLMSMFGGNVGTAGGAIATAVPALLNMIGGEQQASNVPVQRALNIPDSITGAFGVNQAAGMLNTTRSNSPIPSSTDGIMSLISNVFNLLTQQNQGSNRSNDRAMNPTFAPDHYQSNKVPAAMPPAYILRDVFGMDIPTVYKP